MNQVYSQNSAAAPEFLFVATENGAIQRSDAGGVPIKRGLVIIDSTTPLTLTLGAPVPGSSNTSSVGGVPGEDGSILQIVVVAGFDILHQPLSSHTLTTPSAIIQSANGQGPFQSIGIAGVIGSALTLLAYGGQWFVLGGANTSV